MKKPWAVLSAAAALSLVLSACGAKSAAPGQPSATVSPSSATATAEATLPPATPSPTIVPSPTPSPSPSPEVTADYRVNQNYDVVPIKEDGDKKVILLTFDDGPKAEETLLPILDTLDKHKAKAIFFVNGYRIKEKPELLKLIHERGQIIGNHSYDHIHLSEESNNSIDYQIDTVQKQVEELTGSAPVFMRPPNGLSNEYLREKLKKEGILRMNWSNGSLDWTMKFSTPNKPEKVIQNVMDQLHSGSNILMHELAWTGEALDSLLTQLEQKGYSFLDPNRIETLKPEAAK
ncbi:polysaccharide deacetylase family protein [Gorillibacterium timonense]|uniref:polysaccharide deacetylase family protein n=1 Tax=Gorillibacterium timonense TaxID=1689269 RepID=UPI00071D037A|nr:polysaccharide deacetylase family protein [Gorillibacterium timonense]